MKSLKYVIIFLIFSTCSTPEIYSDRLIFNNNFEDGNLDNIDGGFISFYNDQNVLGNYNNDGFNLHLNDIEDHDYIFISFDLYIHGSWDGNLNNFKENDKPDKWIMELRPDMDLHRDVDFDSFVTTFSNSPCFSNWCLRQSFPDEYPAENRPKVGSFSTGLPATCSGFYSSPTSLYKIEKSFRHTGNALILKFYDELYQPNAIDSEGNNVEKCDESWSIDNIKIRAVSYR